MTNLALFYPFFPTRLMNLINHKHSCKIIFFPMGNREDNMTINATSKDHSPTRGTMMKRNRKQTTTCADLKGRGAGGPDPPEKSPKYMVSYQYLSGFPEILKILKASKPALNVVPLSAFRLRANNCPLLEAF